MLEGIGIERDIYRLIVGGYTGMQLGIGIENQSYGYHLTVGGYSGDVDRY